MKIDITKLKEEKQFEDDKIKIIFSIKSLSDSLSVYLKTEDNKELFLVLWQISPDSGNQSFDITNDKIRDFVKAKIAEWEKEEEEHERIEKEKRRKRKENYELNLKQLLDSF